MSEETDVSREDSLTGHRLGQFEILNELGRGGMAVVYRARQSSMDRIVAVKVLPRHLLHEQGFFERFEREVSIISKLEHPHILPIHDYGQAEGIPFIAMRYLGGGNLESLIAGKSPSLEALERPLIQIAEALDYAHGQGVIHRDLKPANIMLDEHGNAYLSDFGIARLMQGSELTGSGIIMGTPSYMSPEQGKGLPADARSDVYALGVMLYELITGRKPYEADTLMALIFKQIHEPIPSVQQHRPSVSSVFDTIIQRATAKEPAERYPSAGALAAAYSAALRPSETPVLSQMEVLNKGKQTIAQKTPKPAQKAVTSSTNQGDVRNRQIMLRNVRSFWVEGVLENSLHNAVLLQLGMSKEAKMVMNPWDTVLRASEKPDTSLAQGTTITEVYDSLQGKLLILGEPGSGKTTALLTLTRDLLSRATEDETHPMPVVFNLSSWAEFHKPLEQWLVDELNSKYQVPRKTGKQWVENDEILLLLDGLDEVKLEHREACVEAINAFRTQHGFVEIVVCSRIADYEALKSRLQLDGAVLLQPLQRGQVDEYLLQAGDELAAVRQVLDDDEKLSRLVTSPLMLNVVTMAYWGAKIEDIPAFDTLEGRRNHLFETYVKRVLERRGADKRYTKEQIRKYMQYIAVQMSKHAQSVLYIEDMQPSWLQGFRQKAGYFFGVRGLTSLAGGVYFYGLSFSIFPFVALALMIAGLFIETSVIIRFNPERIISYVVYIFVPIFLFGLYALFRKLRKRSLPALKSNLWWLVGFGEVSALLVYFAQVTTISGAVAALAQFLYILLVLAFLPGLFLGLYASIRYFFKGNVQPADVVKWSRQQAIKGAFIWGVLLAVAGGAALAFAVFFINLVSAPHLTAAGREFFNNLGTFVWSTFFIGAIPAGVVGLLAGGIIGGLRGTTVEERSQPNQGIKRSWQLGILLAFSSAAIVQILLLPLVGLAQLSSDPATFGFVRSVFENRLMGWPMIGSVLFWFVPFVAMLLGLSNGGYAAIQHATLRAIMWMSGLLPRNVSNFLDYASEHLLMRKVGGGYIFVHRMLMDYFAEMGKEKDKAERVDEIPAYEETIDSDDSMDMDEPSDDFADDEQAKRLQKR